jgi:hypothetical protein
MTKYRWNAKIILSSLRLMDAATQRTSTTADDEEKIPNWKVIGDWFDVCKCEYGYIFR